MFQIDLQDGISDSLKHEPHVLRVCKQMVFASAANRLIGEVVQSRRRPLLGPSPG